MHFYSYFLWGAHSGRPFLQKKDKVMTNEQRTAEELLQQERTIEVAGYEYRICAPTLATLIMASAEISDLPTSNMDHDHIVEEVLRKACRYAKIGKIAAIMILGAKEAKKRRHARLWGFELPFYRKETRADSLGRKLLERHSASELTEIVMEFVKRMESGDFFALTTFLSGANMLKATKVGETTAPGQ